MIDRILYGRFYKGDIMSRMTKEEVKQRVCKAIVLEKCDISIEFLTKENEEALWHILYSVEDKNEIVHIISLGRSVVA